MRNVLVALVLLLFSCHHKVSNAGLIEKMVADRKADWGISLIDYKWENFDYYGQPLYDCVIKIDPGRIKNENSYVINFANRASILVEMFELNELELAKKVYEKATLYAQKIRITPRKDYGELCEPIHEWDFHYVHINGKKIYLIGRIDGGNIFKNGDASLESDKAILYEAREIYEYIKKYSK
ncbi:MAG TPA: hypothetical protein VK666_24150 [Chryseolinea sp.]|nr:hypothetical protein [Chryseolinea sp.]